MNSKIIYDLCAGSGNWSLPYLEAGYIVYHVEIEKDKDVRLIHKPHERIYGVLAAPPCTVFASSGARWERTKEEMLEGLSVVDACLRFVFSTNPHFWALENPVGKLVSYLGKPDFYFDPCDFGDTYTKRTCLWGKFNKPIFQPTVPIGKNPIHNMPPLKDRPIRRSATSLKFAYAFFEVNK